MKSYTADSSAGAKAPQRRILGSNVTEGVKNFERHYEEIELINAAADEVFAYADNHANFSSHMNKSSWMMGGSKMETSVDVGKGRKIGSHIRMSGKAFGLTLFLDEVVIQHEPPYRKAWETVGNLKLLVIDHYKLGFEISPDGKASKLKVFIDYDLPKNFASRLLGYLFGGVYAKWCVNQMIGGVREHFLDYKKL